MVILKKAKNWFSRPIVAKYRSKVLQNATLINLPFVIKIFVMFIFDRFYCSYSTTSMVHTLMAHSPGLAITSIMVTIGHFRQKSSWMGELPLIRTKFHGP